MIRAAFYISLASLLFLFSCKKNDVVGVQATYTGNPQVNFNNYMDDNGNFGYHKVDLLIKDSFVNVNIEIKLTNTTGTAPNDINIYLMKVDALVSDYNTANGTTLEPIGNASAAIDFDFSKPVVLKKGMRTVTIPIKVNTAKLDLTKQKAIGIAIMRVEGADLNTGVESKLVVEFGTRNQYDGRYRLNGAFYHPTSQPNNTPFTINVELWSTGSASVKMYSPDLGGFYHPWLATTGSFTAFQGQEPTYTVDPATNKVTVQNTAAGAVTFYTMNPTYNSRYNPATKTIYAQFGYNYVGGNFVLGTSRQFTDTLTYLGPR